ncbi:hypothetical protein ACFVZW_06830 [Streptomyces sp. NPDC059567]|uniref:hypothetical protein n=1 Tax=Streptomyces sp. NPDC059567 TaxID=3346867 RepID=UPI0036C7704D
MSGVRVGVLGGAAALALGMLAALPAGAADGGLSITGPVSAKVELDDHGKRDHLHGPLPLVITNSGRASVTPVIAAYLDATGGEYDQVCTRTGAAMASQTDQVKAIGSNQARAAVIDLVVPEQCVGREGTLRCLGAEHPSGDDEVHPHPRSRTRAGVHRRAHDRRRSRARRLSPDDRAGQVLRQAAGELGVEAAGHRLPVVGQGSASS